MAGELADRQIAVFVDYCKKQKYEDAVASLYDHIELFRGQPEFKASAISNAASSFAENFNKHGKVLGYTKWRTRSLSKNKELVVYQINCEWSALMVELWEYTSLDGHHFINEVRLVTEEDIFKAYEK